MRTMAEHGFRSARAGSSQSAGRTNRRGDARDPFTAAVTVDPGSGAHIEARTSDLSSNGCYVDAMSPFSRGSRVHIRLTKEGRSFETSARVVYSNPGIGMGLEFTPEQAGETDLLKAWIAEIRGEAAPAHSFDEFERAEGAGVLHLQNDRSERQALRDLLVLMMHKGLITEQEGGPILRHLLK